MNNKRNIALNMNTIEMNFHVNTYDIDLAGHVNNIVYVRWLEDLRNKLLNEKFNLKKIITESFYPVVVSTIINYKKQIRIFDKPNGVIEFRGCKHGILNFKSIIKLKDIIAAKAEQRCVIINLKNSKMISQNEFIELAFPFKNIG
ncbi:MAG: thioesterase family protein [Ignavibacteria bacterium]|jgi:acyl-CoA thioester hydrolase